MLKAHQLKQHTSKILDSLHLITYEPQKGKNCILFAINVELLKMLLEGRWQGGALGRHLRKKRRVPWPAEYFVPG
jgi:hypothetical protein